MAFWGVEVKPGKPFTHSFDRVRGRLRISQATLGIGSAIKKSLVQCNVGGTSPVFLCALLPDKTESCHLDLEFEEADEVIFSVIGPRSVYLTGYYLGNGRHAILNDDTDSYGEDIANTETDQSANDTDEDRYEDSFIDDSDPEIFPSSPVSNKAVDEEDMKDEKKPNRRLKKKYQSIDTDDDDNSQQENVANECKSGKAKAGLESEDEDHFPISSLYKMEMSKSQKKAEKNTDEKNCKKKEEKGTHAEAEIDSTLNPKAKDKHAAIGMDGEPESSLVPHDDVGTENGPAMEKKTKDMAFQESDPVAHNWNCGNVLKEDQVQPMEQETECLSKDIPAKSQQDQKPKADEWLDLSCHPLLYTDKGRAEKHSRSTKKRKKRMGTEETNQTDRANHSSNQKSDEALRDETPDQKLPTDSSAGWTNSSSLPFTITGLENDTKSKKRSKRLAAEGKSDEASSANCKNVLEEGQVKQNEGGEGKNLVMEDQDQKQCNDKPIEFNSGGKAGDDHKDKKAKRKKRKSGTKENEENMDIDVSSLSVREGNRSLSQCEDKNIEAKSSQPRTLSSGLIIEELQKGKPDGKMAAPGKKVKVHFMGKLRETGTIVDSNIGKAPFKFRLGAEDVIVGWNFGLDGMRIGDKRRLTIPPSMGYGSQGAGENVPPNSWLVYEVELVGVR